MPILNITKNQGLIYGLRQYIQSQNKTFSLDPSKYTKVMEAFKQINKGRQTAGEASIYTGGENYTGKVDWHKNFVVQEGKINLTEDEMNMLYQAMGLEITTTQNPGNDTTPGGDQDPESPQGGAGNPTE